MEAILIQPKGVVSSPATPALLRALVAAVGRSAEFLRRVPLGTHTFAGVQRGDEVVSAWLGADEAALLRALGGAREGALRLARQGDLSGAEEAIAYARAALSRTRLSPRATLLARSLHHAAEPYLRYRHGLHAEALGELDAALACTNAASDEHGFPGAEARRLHLAQVTVRVQRVRGDDPVRVAETVSRLWRYVEGAAECWPLVPLVRPAAPIALRMAAITLNEIVTEAAVLMAERPETAGDALAVLRPHLAVPARAADDTFAYPRAWLRVKALRHAGASGPLLEAAAEFLATVDGPRPLLWLSALADARQVAGTVVGRAARAAENRIARAVEGLPGDVPACLRGAAAGSAPSSGRARP